MAWVAPRTSAFNDRVIIERKGGTARNAIGGLVDEWTVVADNQAAAVEALRGGEEVRAGRLSGISRFTVVLRCCDLTRQIVPSDRLTDRQGRVHDIKWIGSLDHAQRFLVLETETGGASNG